MMSVFEVMGLVEIISVAGVNLAFGELLVIHSTSDIIITLVISGYMVRKPKLIIRIYYWGQLQ